MEKDDGDALLSTPHQLLGMVDDDFAGLERRLMEALQHVHETGLIRPSDIQLPILSSPPTVTQSIPGYEGGELDPQTLGVACIGLPPSEGRGANKEGAAYNLNPAGKKLKTSQDGLLRKRMTARPNEGFDAPEFIGAWYKYFLEQPPVDFLVADPAANRPWPYVCFHMPKQTRVAAPEPATAVDETSTPADAPSTGPLAAGDVTGLVERLSLAGAASNSDGGAVAGEGKGGTLDRALAPTLGLHVSCAHCGKQKGALKQCARCLQVSYCGAGCQKVAWKGHKMTCVSLKDVFDKDWRGVLKWEGRMDDLMEHVTEDADRSLVLRAFLVANRSGMFSSGYTSKYALSILSLDKRRVELLGKMQRFRDQGEAMCGVGAVLEEFGRSDEASEWYQRARAVGAAHGFFSVECEACQGLGMLAIKAGRAEEGEDLLQNALVAASLSENNSNIEEAGVLADLMDTLFARNAVEELQPLVLRYRAVTKAVSKVVSKHSKQRGHLCALELRSLVFSARLQEVLHPMLETPLHCSAVVQARGRHQEAAREVRALLDLLRGIDAAVQDRSVWQHVLVETVTHLKMLHPGQREQELGRLVAVELAKLSSG